MKTYRPALFVALAALIWGTDSLVRYPAASQLPPSVLVLLEHLIGLVLVAPIVMIKYRHEFKKLNAADLSLALCVGLAGACLGGIFYTSSITRIGPSASTLFQMIQPLFVLGLAYFFLREKRSSSFFQVGVWVALNAILLGLPDFNFGFLAMKDSQQSQGVLYGFLAMTMWGISTVAGKALLSKYSPVVVVFFRFLIASFSLSLIVGLRGSAIPWRTIATINMGAPLLYLGSFAGVFAMWVYYKGMQSLPASIVTFIELLYPLAGVLFPVLYFGSSISGIQTFGAIALIFSLLLLLGLEYPTLRRHEIRELRTGRTAL